MTADIKGLGIISGSGHVNLPDENGNRGTKRSTDWWSVFSKECRGRQKG